MLTSTTKGDITSYTTKTAVTHTPVKYLQRTKDRPTAVIPSDACAAAFLKGTAFHPFYHLNYCYYVVYSSLHCLVVPFANFGCA